MTLDRLARAEGLFVSGVVPETGHAVLLLSPDEPGYWDILTASPEWTDGGADPVDRWSTRVVGALAAAVGGETLFPFGGPPWHPFYGWAVAGGRAMASPVTLLADADRGLWISYRGAIRLPDPDGALARSRPLAPGVPCTGCSAPCRTACPVGALSERGYDVAASHGYLDTDAGRDCLTGGCLVRRACPVGAERRPRALAAYHMEMFHR